MSKPDSKAKRIYNIVTTIIVALIFVFLLTMVSVLLIQKKNGGESQLFGYYLFDVLTDSMSGTIEQGEVIICQKVDEVNDLEIGDIITFTAPSGQLKGYNETHRIVNIVYKGDGGIDYIETAGDKLYNGNIKKDEWHLSPDNVKAVFVKKSAFIGGLRNFLSHWYGYVILIAIPLCIVFTLIIVGFVRDRLALASQENQKALTLENLSDEDKKKLLESLADVEHKDEGKERNETKFEMKNALENPACDKEDLSSDDTQNPHVDN